MIYNTIQINITNITIDLQFIIDTKNITIIMVQKLMIFKTIQDNITDKNTNLQFIKDTIINT